MSEVTAVGSSSSSTSMARSELLRAQHKLAADLAARHAEKVAAVDKAAVTTDQTEALRQRQETGGTVDLLL